MLRDKVQTELTANTASFPWVIHSLLHYQHFTVAARLQEQWQMYYFLLLLCKEKHKRKSFSALLSGHLIVLRVPVWFEGKEFRNEPFKTNICCALLNLGLIMQRRLSHYFFNHYETAAFAMAQQSCGRCMLPVAGSNTGSAFFSSRGLTRLPPQKLRWSVTTRVPVVAVSMVLRTDWDISPCDSK